MLFNSWWFAVQEPQFFGVYIFTVQSVLHLLALAFSQEDILVYFKCLKITAPSKNAFFTGNKILPDSANITRNAT